MNILLINKFLYPKGGDAVVGAGGGARRNLGSYIAMEIKDFVVKVRNCIIPLHILMLI
jgi:hypothetical protein